MTPAEVTPTAGDAGPQALGAPIAEYKGVSVFADGLSYTNRGRAQVVRLEDVNTVWYGGTKIQGMFTVEACTMELGDGSKHSFSNNGKLAEVIQLECTRRILPRVLTYYQSGETISFGKLTVSKAGIGKHQETLPWDMVKRISLDQGILSIWKHGGLFKWAQIYVAQTPNFWVFAYLVGSETCASLKRRVESSQSIEQMLWLGRDLGEAHELQAFGASVLAPVAANG